MDFASSRRLFFILIFALLIGATAFILIRPYFNRPPTCFDNKKNGTEMGIDCGGSCKYLCSESVKQVPVEWSRSFLNKNKTVDMVAHFSNQNKTAGVEKADYRFVVYGRNGQTLLTKEGSTFIPANTKVIVYEGPFSVGNQEPYTTTFEWTSPLKFSTVPPAESLLHLDTLKTDLKTEGGVTLTALVGNSTTATFSRLPVYVVLYNTEGNAILASRTLIDSLAPEETTELYFSWNYDLKEKVGDIEIVPAFKPTQK